jgi:hypothetical protein
LNRCPFRKWGLLATVVLALACTSAPRQATLGDFTAEQRRMLESHARLYEAPPGLLTSLALDGVNRYRLSTPLATGFAIEVSGLAANAGEMGKAPQLLQSTLDLGAARGMTPKETLDALRLTRGSSATYKRATGEE